MSINKNAYLRYQVLDKCFSNRFKNYFIEDLLDEVNKALEDFNGYDSRIEKRQLFDDLKFMESEAGWSVPLERYREGRKVYYRYSDLDFSIKNQKISDEEIDAINTALMVLHRFKGIPQFDWVNELSPKLQSLFKQDETPEVISFDHNEYLKGLEFLPGLYQSIVNRVVLSIEYQSFKDKESKKFIIHPYYLKQYNKRWFLFGLNDEMKLIYNLALDRIKSIDTSHSTYIKNSGIDFNEYFEDLVGVSLNQGLKPIKILLHFNKESAPYIFTKPLHGSQKKIEENSNGVTFQIEVIPNFELKQLLLSYGASVEILSPAAFRNEFILIIDEMKKKYNSNNQNEIN